MFPKPEALHEHAHAPIHVESAYRARPADHLLRARSATHDMAAGDERGATLFVQADHTPQFLHILGVVPLPLLLLFEQHRHVVAILAQGLPVAELCTRLAYHPPARVAVHVEADTREALLALVRHGLPQTHSDAALE
jgi:hypothetical protein